MEDPYARHGRDKFLELLIDSFSKLNRRDFDRSPLISAVPRSWKLSVSTAMKNTSWCDVRRSYSEDRQRQRSQENRWRILAYDIYAIDMTCDLSFRWLYEFAFSSRTINVAHIIPDAISDRNISNKIAWSIFHCYIRNFVDCSISNKSSPYRFILWLDD